MGTDKFYFILYKIVFSLVFVASCPASKSPEISQTPTLLRTLRIQMGNKNGDGMDGGVFRKKDWGGGRFSLKFCFPEIENQCCETGTLNTDDDNWEQGEVNYFVGYQIGNCQNFPLDKEGKLQGLRMDLNEKLTPK